MLVKQSLSESPSFFLQIYVFALYHVHRFIFHVFCYRAQIPFALLFYVLYVLVD